MKGNFKENFPAIKNEKEQVSSYFVQMNAPYEDSENNEDEIIASNNL